MNPTVQSAIVSGVAIIVIALITQRNNRRGQDDTNRLVDRQVGREEFDALARELRASLNDERRLRQRADRRVTQLEKAMRDAGMELPVVLADPPDAA